MAGYGNDEDRNLVTLQPQALVDAGGGGLLETGSDEEVAAQIDRTTTEVRIKRWRVEQ